MGLRVEKFAEATLIPRGAGILGSASKSSSRAFFFDAGTEARLINKGFSTLSQTRAGQILMKMTEGMLYYPGSQAYNR